MSHNGAVNVKKMTCSRIESWVISVYLKLRQWLHITHMLLRNMKLSTEHDTETA